MSWVYLTLGVIGVLVVLGIIAINTVLQKDDIRSEEVRSNIKAVLNISKKEYNEDETIDITLSLMNSGDEARTLINREQSTLMSIAIEQCEKEEDFDHYDCVGVLWNNDVDPYPYVSRSLTLLPDKQIDMHLIIDAKEVPYFCEELKEIWHEWKQQCIKKTGLYRVTGIVRGELLPKEDTLVEESTNDIVGAFIAINPIEFMIMTNEK